MTQFSDQLSAVRQAQLEAQLDMFRNLTTRALDSAGQLAALNVRTSRASLEQAAGTFRHLLDAREPRDLFALGSAAQNQWHTMFSYGRELFGLATGARMLPASLPMPVPLLTTPAPTANVPTSYTQIVDQVSIATDAATSIGSEISAAAVDTGTALAEAAIDAGTRNLTQPEAAPEPEPAPAAAPASALAPEPAPAPAPEPVSAPAQDDAQRAEFEAAIETAIADDHPPAEPTALAKALNEVSPKPIGAEHPLASTVALQAEGQVELPQVTPSKASRGSRRK
jgi:hypothetical protein